MRPDRRFARLPKYFWANIRTISQRIGYTRRRSGQISVPTVDEIRHGLNRLGLSSRHLFSEAGRPTPFGKRVLAYFQHRADMLNQFVEPRLMNVEDARTLFERLQAERQFSRPPPMNKQSGTKKAPAYFTACINMLIEAHAQNYPVDFDPRELTTVTRNGAPLRTLARRVDGAFPSPVNPIAVWEIKEYYYTTTFGSRVADGVYETLLDGMELEELRLQEQIDVKHYLMIDAKYTWWDCGRSYLCRIIDMLHMGHVDEVLFGKEIVDRLPALVAEWVRLERRLRRQSRISRPDMDRA